MGRQSQRGGDTAEQGWGAGGCRDSEAGLGDVTANTPEQSLEGEVKELNLKAEAEREQR